MDNKTKKCSSQKGLALKQTSLTQYCSPNKPKVVEYSDTSQSKVHRRRANKSSGKKKPSKNVLTNWLDQSSKVSSIRQASSIQKRQKSKYDKMDKQVKSLLNHDGVQIQPIEKFLQQKEKLEVDKENLKKLGAKLDTFEFQPFRLNSPVKKHSQELNCKYLSAAAIEQAFHNNISYLTNVWMQSSKKPRKEVFMANNDKIGIVLAFRDEHKLQILSLLDKTFGTNVLGSNQFLFQIMLTETCLKIFQDEYHFDHKEVLEYINEMNIA